MSFSKEDHPRETAALPCHLASDCGILEMGVAVGDGGMHPRAGATVLKTGTRIIISSCILPRVFSSI